MEPKDFEGGLSNSPRESIDVLDVRSITTRRGTYTQYLVRWPEKPSSEDAWIFGEELKKLDQLLWEDLNSNSKVSSFQEGENDAGASLAPRHNYPEETSNTCISGRGNKATHAYLHRSAPLLERFTKIQSVYNIWLESFTSLVSNALDLISFEDS
ncbi:hypothetical protein CJ030_MR0G005504 [Morella rubra]|uniref:Chromo domain-containing protein n=1 Tax=Morella rubra TaxID=262757 RepID=A0A6A1UKM3_9ROSI|nr:hypothetical protein CJ030_MR0G005504 [Morella rubra]